jgi:hypothetical protein
MQPLWSTVVVKMETGKTEHGVRVVADETNVEAGIAAILRGEVSRQPTRQDSTVGYYVYIRVCMCLVVFGIIFYIMYVCICISLVAFGIVQYVLCIIWYYVLCICMYVGRYVFGYYICGYVCIWLLCMWVGMYLVIMYVDM